MASHGDDDFEIIDAPSKNILLSIRSKHEIATCQNPFCQFSHVSREEECASERAIEPLITVMQATAAAFETKGPIFHAKISSAYDRDLIFDAFTSVLPVQYRRIMNCSACKQFCQQYGDLCIIEDDGGLIPLAFPTTVTHVPEYYKQSVQTVVNLFAGKAVGDEFNIQSETGRTLGFPTKGGWNHLSIVLEKLPVARTNDSMNAQDTNTSFTMLNRILEDNSPEVIARVYHIIHENQLPYAESHKAPLTFLQTTVEKLTAQNAKNPIKRTNLITKLARSAFPGCLSSLRGGMLGYLFECVNKGQDFDTLKHNWMTKADPLSYMRPTAAPSTGNVESAEKIFARMGYTPRDLERVFLTLDQVPQSAILWASSSTLSWASESSTSYEKEDVSKTSKLFGHLLPPKYSKLAPTSYTDAPINEVSFRHFVLKILPTISTMEALPTDPLQPYFFTTGKPGSKPIMSFHSGGSHTASWYTWGHAGALSNASLKEKFTPVKAVITFPHMWDDLAAPEVLDEAKVESFKHKRHGIRLLFVLAGAKEKVNPGLCLFPTLMKGEFHSVRKTVEACSNSGRLEQPEAGDHVGGICVEKNKPEGDRGILLGVRTKGGQVSRYRITLFE
jgi:hypothetical protein